MQRLPGTVKLHILSPILGGLMLLGAVGAIAALAPATEAVAQAGGADAVSAEAKSSRVDPAKVMGFGKCVDCHAGPGKAGHKSETGVWMKSKHFNSEKTLDAPNAAKYAKSLGISLASLRVDSMCVSCHATVKLTAAGNASKPVAVSGVSCESCHGGAGDWLNQHGSYGPKGTKREAETAEHRKSRIAGCRKAGMIRSDDLHGIATNCLGCHVIDNAKLVKAGHKERSDFEFASWSSGEIRHNLFLDPQKNAEAPTLWAAREGGTAANRKRVKWAIGMFVELEVLLRARAKLTDADDYDQAEKLYGRTNTLIGRRGLRLVPHDEATKTVAIVKPIQQMIVEEDPMPRDAKLFGDAADEVARLARAFVTNHDGSKLETDKIKLLIEKLEPKGTVFEPK